jgi:hypothetical protein
MTQETERRDPQRFRSYRSGLTSFLFRPGEQAEMRCQICNAICDVRRNVLTAGYSAEFAAGQKSRYDTFHCPNVGQEWHDTVTDLVDEGLSARSRAALEEQNQRFAERARQRGTRGLLRRVAAWFLAKALQALEGFQRTRNKRSDM